MGEARETGQAVSGLGMEVTCHMHGYALPQKRK